MIESPCIGVCSLNKGICIGCKRKESEIIEWLYLSDEDRNRITIRCLKEMEKGLSSKKGKIKL